MSGKRSLWLADLLAHGLIRASFVPDVQTQEQRGLLRTRKQLTRERTSHVQRVQKTLEEANIKLDSVISDLIGASGRSMIEALIAGETDPGTFYQDLGADHFQRRAKPNQIKRFVAKIQSLGYNVEIKPLAA